MARILITGTSKGIGYHSTLLLARAGHEVVAAMRSFFERVFTDTDTGVDLRSAR